MVCFVLLTLGELVVLLKLIFQQSYWLIAAVQLAAIANSTEYKLGLRRNAILNPGGWNKRIVLIMNTNEHLFTDWSNINSFNLV